MSLAAQAAAVQRRPAQVRNLCVLAHVDHGKTTLSDFLVSSNGVISSKLAGSARYLDSRADEQERQITMKSSSICLVYQDKEAHDEAAAEARTDEERRAAVRESFYVVNLIDSPGHVDFSSEVSNALRCTDGALVLIEAVDGACAQTYAVLQQAWAEGVRPCLVINKIDRLIVELRMTPMEAYLHILQLLERVNAFASSFHVGDRLARAEELDEAHVDFDDDEGLFFSPSAGNVIFASAIDNWAFGLAQFARLYEAKLGMRREALMRALWGDYFYQPKTRSVSRKPGKLGRPMFVQFILDQVWAVYQRVLEEENAQLMHKIIDKLGVKVPARELATPNWRARMRAIFSRWLPVAPAVLGMVVRHLPSPVEAAAHRLPKFWPAAAEAAEGKGGARAPAVASAERCDTAGPLVLYVAKMVYAGDTSVRSAEPARGAAQPRKFVRRAYVKGRFAGGGAADAEQEQEEDREQAGGGEEGDDNDDDGKADDGGAVRKKRFLAFARVFSGTLDTRPESEQEVHVFAPKYDPADPAREEHHTVVLSRDLSAYMLMGRDLQPVGEVAAGSVCGIAGLDGVVINTATVSTDAACPPLCPMRFQSAPIVRVALHTRRLADMPRLLDGLRLLNQADANVHVMTLESGETVIAASGEVHLERCIVDLHDRFAPGVPFEVSKPLVEFRETIVRSTDEDLAREAEGVPVTDSEPEDEDEEDAGDKEGDDESDADEEKAEAGRNDRGDGNDEKSVDSDEEGVPSRKRVRPFSFSRSARTADRRCRFRMRALPLPDGVVRALGRRQAALLAAVQAQGTAGAGLSASAAADSAATLAAVREEVREELAAAGAPWCADDVDLVWSLGPRRSGANALLCRVPGLAFTPFWEGGGRGGAIGAAASAETVAAAADGDEASPAPSERAASSLGRLVESSIVSGFQLATAHGPLCAEPMTGVAFVVEEAEVTPGRLISGQIISAVRKLCERVFRARPMRLVEAMYSVELHVTAELLGRLHAVLTQRRARVVSEDLKEGTPYFLVRAHLPVAESFGFAQLVRKRTSGVASPQLVFSHWETMQQDPYWRPTTEEELEEFGAAESGLVFPNLVRDLMHTVRVRKGLEIEKKIVEHAEKQRTLARKK